MSRKLIYRAILLCVFFTSCKKIGLITKNNNPAIASTTFPSYFTWETSRNIKVTLNITDLQFGNARYLISIYDGDPSAGGTLLSKGSATLKMAFISTVYLSSELGSLYIVKTSPDHSRTLLKIEALTSVITASLGARVISPVLNTDKIPSRFVF